MAYFKRDSIFFLSLLALVLSIENIFTFPLNMYFQGGFVFLLPRFLVYIFLAIPVILMELQMGKKYRQGQMGAFSNANSSMGGIGVLSLVGGLVIYTYVNMMMAWALYFFVLSFYSPNPFL